MLVFKRDGETVLSLKCVFFLGVVPTVLTGSVCAQLLAVLFFFSRSFRLYHEAIFESHTTVHTHTRADTWTHKCVHTHSLSVLSSTVVQAQHTKPQQKRNGEDVCQEKVSRLALGYSVCVWVCVCRTGKGETAASEVYHNHYSAQGREEM